MSNRSRTQADVPCSWWRELHRLWLAAVEVEDVTALATRLYAALSLMPGSVAVVGARWERRAPRYMRLWTPADTAPVTWLPTATDWPGGLAAPSALTLPDDGRPHTRWCAPFTGTAPESAPPGSPEDVPTAPSALTPFAAPLLREAGAEVVLECLFPLASHDTAALWVGFAAMPDTEDRRRMGEQLTQVADLLMVSNRRILENRVHERRQARDAFLAEASLQMDESLEVEETLRRVARLAVPAVAEGCVVHLFRADRELEPVAAAHVAAGAQTWLGEVARHDAWLAAQLRRTARHPGGRVLQGPELSGGPFGPDATGEGKTIRAVSISPLRARGRVLGTLTFLYRRDDTSLSDLPTLTDLAGRAALAIDTATLYDQRRQNVEMLQRHLLPRALPRFDGVELSAAYEVGDTSLDVGGDFYDAVAAGDRISLVIGDVCGRGAEAAAFTSLARHTLRILLEEGTPPGAALARLNRALTTEGASRFVTALVATLTPLPDGGSEAEIAGAGHPWPLLRHADGTVTEVAARGLLLGVVPNAPYRSRRVRLADGDALVLFTDGLTEARSADGAYFEARLADAVSGLDPAGEAPAARLVGAASDFRHMGDDDTAVLIARVKGRP
ncbi:SpoIIE family protein phosphatase [Streptomyces sp. J2-1]|uniref:PP2C family protein-serine/threonine phosphatase n=1 Tax=Streptomyces corallincola TaxID=2851888 RepID=UPI001C38D2D5|nr:GAF domain-containing SpoIIE family protein phosphatase [Streptomyces corallincola]MBV2357061.1 SpoIIE family protein phosphatase [Streptomyces corallincola]